MKRVTVRWHTASEEDLAELWMSASDAVRIERAVYEDDGMAIVWHVRLRRD